MTAFNPRRAAEILEGVLDRHFREASRLGGDALWLIMDGYPSWHRLVRETQSRADAEWDRYWSLKDHIEWLRAEDAHRVAKLGMSR